jgi:pimeloyl-ACP methyl ester carboxylesterase
LVLHRSSNKHIAFSDKSQEPMPPFPYPTEEVSFQHDSISLAGTLSMPKGVKSAPAVILITGSGQQNRDEEIMGHKPFLVIADYLTRHGYAVLRYDDRGMGGSTGAFETATTADFAQDVRAAMAYLKSRKDITSVGLIGHSEGSAVAAMVAADNADVAFVISLAGPGIKGDSLLLLQQQMLLPDYYKLQSDIDATIAQNKALFAIINLNKSTTETAQLIRDYLNTQKIPAPENNTTSHEDLINQITGMVNNPWMRYFLKHNPADDFSKVHCPVLALNGDKDKQVPAEVNLSNIAAALTKAGNKDVTTTIVKGKNHLFQSCTTCTIQEYSTLDETFSEEVMAMMLEWMRKR